MCCHPAERVFTPGEQERNEQLGKEVGMGFMGVITRVSLPVP